VFFVFVMLFAVMFVLVLFALFAAIRLPTASDI
jgi:hypothetical protein